MIYPRLSPSGTQVIGGNDGIFLNGVMIPPLSGDTRSYGTSPVWANESTIYFTYSRHNADGTKHHLDGQLMKYIINASNAVLVGKESGNVLTAGGNLYALWRPGFGVEISNSINIHVDWHSPALSEQGIIAHGVNNDGTSTYAWGGTTVARENIVAHTLEVVIDVNNPNARWETLQIESFCGKPIPVWTGKELFFLFHTNDGCVFLMEYGSNLGYVIRPRGFDGGSGYTHDAKSLSDKLIRVISPAFDEVIDLTSQRVPIPPGDEMACTPVCPGHDVLEPSFNRIREFCQNYVAPPHASPEYAGKKPYVADEIHENGLFLSQGLNYFMFGNTGRYAEILMNPDDKRGWPEKVDSAEKALFNYMRARVGDVPAQTTPGGALSGDVNVG